MQDSSGGSKSNQVDADGIAQIAKALNLQYISMREDFLIFEILESNLGRKKEAAIPAEAAVEIIEAINRGAGRMEEYEGWIDPENGFVEFEVRQEGIVPFRRMSTEKFTFDIRACSHSHEFSPGINRDADSEMVFVVLHVTSSDGSTCIEISPNSSLCVPLWPVELDSRRLRMQSTLKIHLGRSTEKVELQRRALSLANSFIFELNARHRAAYSLRPRMESPSFRRAGQSISYTVRFPKTPVPENVAALFSIPNDFSMRGNHTLFYLSYYQILEHYLPAVHKRETVRKVRRILRSLDFDEEKDSSVLQILSSVERSHGASEGEQLRMLVAECVPEGKLLDFFALDHGGHFDKNGPISGVSAINVKSGEPLASQVAKRIYKLRNRIVHAKDDVRYAESKVLLPLSREALRLRPDIDLLRLLAIEVIVDNR
ncbi:hypothetical protein ACGFYZ_36815 [Streptomyces sp. NPDC048330]|uniref:hypothetical protein n=1 Tax=Streptomyces sp. NPDC048330 TaxID=3365533 RepID=UPI003716D700